MWHSVKQLGINRERFNRSLNKNKAQFTAGGLLEFARANIDKFGLIEAPGDPTDLMVNTWHCDELIKGTSNI